MEQKTRQQLQEEKPQEKPQQKPRQRRLWEWTKFGEKGLWDWLQLLIVPIALVVIGFLFNAAQERNQQAAEEHRARSQQEVEEQRAQDAALQAYLGEMGSLLLEEDLLDSRPRTEVNQLAKARTLAVLEQVAPSHKRTIIQFLYEVGLITHGEPQPPSPVVILSLREANLSDAELGSLRLWALPLLT